MAITIRPVTSPAECEKFVRFAWQANRGDAYWVPPVIADRLAKLDPQRNSFWKTADRALWMTLRDGQVVGTIAAIHDRHAIATLSEPVGMFGFFECRDDPESAGRLFDTAAEWLKAKGCDKMRGPYNPSPSDETGVLVEGFDSRPALLMGHNPRYYQSLFEEHHFCKFNDLLARLWRRPVDSNCLEDTLPEKILRVAARASQRTDLKIRQVRLKEWDQEIAQACDIYNQALNDLPGYVAISQDEFKEFAASFRPLVEPRLTLIAEIAGRAVGFALALPDINEALQRVNGRLDWIGLGKLWWYSRHLERVSFKILMIIPEYQRRGIECVLGMKIAQELWNSGYREVDLSLTGEENIKSTQFQENLGFQIYRRYRIYEKGI
jgi:GNAT superfamily N-acetyltransferase